MKSRLILTALVVALLVLLTGVAHADDTVSVTVALYDSSGQPLSGGTVQVYRSGWQSLGVTDANDQVDAELPSGSYTFRVSYSYAYNEKTQNVGADSTVVFGTVRVTVKLQDAGGHPVDPGTARYYASDWRAFGVTFGGQVSRELLPKTYPFRMTYDGTTTQKSQDVAVDR